MRLFDRALAWISHAMLVLGAILLALMAVHVVADVLGRFMFRHPLPGTIEVVSRYYMIAVIFLPLAYVQMRRAHILTDQFTAYLPRRCRQVIEGLVGLLATIVLAILTWRGALEALRVTRIGEQAVTADFAIPSWPPHWFVPLGFGVMGALTLAQGVRDLLGLVPADRHGQEAAHPDTSA